MTLADPGSNLAFASCDFRNPGITRNSLQFVAKSGLECAGDSGHSNHPQQMTPCLEIKDSLGACHLIVMPSPDVSCDWEDGVQHIKAFPHNATSDLDQSVEAIGGIRELLKSLDSVATRADWLKRNGNNLDGEEVESADAQSRHSSAVLQQELKRTAAFGAQQAALSSGSTKPSESILKTQLPLSLQERSPSIVVSERRAVPSINQRVEESPPHAAAWSARDRFVQPQKHGAAHSLRNSSINSTRFQLKAQIVGHLQSFEDDHENMPLSSAPLRADSRMRDSTSIDLHPAAFAPRAFRRHERNSSDDAAAPERHGRTDVPPSRSLSLHLSPPGRRSADVVDEDAGGSSNRPAAGEVTAGQVMAGVAARINGALAAFANFGNT